MATSDDDEFTALERLVDGSGDPGSAEEAWVRARAVELVKSMDPSPAVKGKGGHRRN